MEERAVWAVLLSRDVDAAMRFYGEALGWQFQSFSEADPPYWIARSADGVFVSVFIDASESGFPDRPEVWLPYFAVDDVDQRARDAERLDATILRPPVDIPELGRVVVLRQPSGGIVAWRSPSTS